MFLNHGLSLKWKVIFLNFFFGYFVFSCGGVVLFFDFSPLGAIWITVLTCIDIFFSSTPKLSSQDFFLLSLLVQFCLVMLVIFWYLSASFCVDFLFVIFLSLFYINYGKKWHLICTSTQKTFAFLILILSETHLIKSNVIIFPSYIIISMAESRF